MKLISVGGKITVIQFPELKVPNEGRNYEELFQEVDRIEDDPVRKTADDAIRAWERVKNL